MMFAIMFQAVSVLSASDPDAAPDLQQKRVAEARMRLARTGTGRARATEEKQDCMRAVKRRRPNEDLNTIAGGFEAIGAGGSYLPAIVRSFGLTHVPRNGLTSFDFSKTVELEFQQEYTGELVATDNRGQRGLWPVADQKNNHQGLYRKLQGQYQAAVDYFKGEYSCKFIKYRHRKGYLQQEGLVWSKRRPRKIFHGLKDVGPMMMFPEKKDLQSQQNQTTAYAKDFSYIHAPVTMFKDKDQILDRNLLAQTKDHLILFDDTTDDYRNSKDRKPYAIHIKYVDLQNATKVRDGVYECNAVVILHKWYYESDGKVQRTLEPEWYASAGLYVQKSHHKVALNTRITLSFKE